MPTLTLCITAGEPAGIGPGSVPDAGGAKFGARLVVIADRDLLAGRACSFLGCNGRIWHQRRICAGLHHRAARAAGLAQRAPVS